MNDTTEALMDLFQIDRKALDAHREFYRDRTPLAYAAGRWGKPIGPFDTYLADFEAPDCPEGWETFRGFLARTEPMTLALMETAADTDAVEEAALDALSRISGFEPIRVSSPAWLLREGVFEIAAFPTQMLQAFAAAEQRA